MTQMRRDVVGTATVLGVLGIAACGPSDPEQSTQIPATDEVTGVPGEIRLVPGPELAEGRLVENPYTGDARAIGEGQRLYTWYNCGGCHGALGGGGMGPPLRDEQWIYGEDPVSIYRSIMQGRPEGMPGWIGKIPDDQVWMIVAYIQALGDGGGFQPPLQPPVDRVPSGGSGQGALSPTEP